MNDRELLELAANAADITHDGVGYVSPTGLPMNWNPLTDDGDALRLAVKLQLTICNEQVSAGVAYCIRGDIDDFPEARSATPDGILVTEADYDATRRAIVLAAAEIGKGKK